MRGLRDVASGLQLAALLRRLRPDVVHAHNRPSDGWTMFWSAAARVPGRLYTRHLTYTDWSPAMRRRYRLAARTAHAVVAVSSAVAGHLAKEEGTPTSKIVPIPNGVDLARFDTSLKALRDRGSAIRARWGIPRKAPLIGALCRLSHQKGLDVFLQVAARVRRAAPDTRFAVVGEGEARADLERRAGALGIADAVFFPGFEEPAASLAAFDLFLATSRYEGLPLTLLEAMAAGRAIIAPRIGAFPEILEEGVTGLLPAPAQWAPAVDSLDPAPFAAAVLRLLAHRRLRARLGEAARKRAEAEHGVETMVTRHAALYERLLHGESRR
jgi:glycosyltransferase involved in cell wall biosynthesis